MKFRKGGDTGTSCHPKQAFSNLYWIRRMSLLSACLFQFLSVYVFQSNVFYDWQTKNDVGIDGVVIDAPSLIIIRRKNNNGTVIANNATVTATATATVTATATATATTTNHSDAPMEEEPTIVVTTTAATDPEIAIPSPTTTTKTQTLPPKAKTKKFKLFQVINTFAINKDKTDDDTIHQPYDQWSTLQSIQRAKQHAPFDDLEITLVCAMFESDERVLVPKGLVPTCDRMSRLERSTVTEYGNITSSTNENYSNSNGTTTKEEELLFSEVFSKRELPFLQDLLDAAVSVARNEKTNHNTAGSTTAEKTKKNSGEDDSDNDNENDFYVMLTNSDIGLTKDFYSFLLPLLEKGQKAYTINRWSIPMGNGGENHPITIRTPTTDPLEVETLLTQIDASLVTGKKHPGYDCFVIHSSVIDQISLGTMYAGFPPWGSALTILLKDVVARNSYMHVQSNPNATFHLGDKGTWSTKKKGETAQAVLKYIKQRYKEDLADCPKPIFAEDPHTVMNSANCGRVFREDYNHTKSHSNSNSKKKKRETSRRKQRK
jgi:hypothetical protein